MKRLLTNIAKIVLVAALILPAQAQKVMADAENGMETPLPVIMYHSLTTQGKGKTIITPQAFEADLKYLTQNGYHCVGVAEILDYVCQGKPLPTKPILLTFDDGYYNNLSQGAPLLRKYGAKIVVSVIGNLVDLWTENGQKSDPYGHLTWDELNQMLDEGLIELSNHTQSMHTFRNGRRGCARKPGETPDNYHKKLADDIGILQRNAQQNCGVIPVCFAYPFGIKSPETLAVLKEIGFKITLTCAPGVNMLKVGDAECLYDLQRLERTPSATLRRLLEGVHTKNR